MRQVIKFKQELASNWLFMPQPSHSTSLAMTVMVRVMTNDGNNAMMITMSTTQVVTAWLKTSVQPVS